MLYRVSCDGPLKQTYCEMDCLLLGQANTTCHLCNAVPKAVVLREISGLRQRSNSTFIHSVDIHT